VETLIRPEELSELSARAKGLTPEALSELMSRVKGGSRDDLERLLFKLEGTLRDIVKSLPEGLIREAHGALVDADVTARLAVIIHMNRIAECKNPKMLKACICLVVREELEKQLMRLRTIMAPDTLGRERSSPNPRLLMAKASGIEFSRYHLFVSNGMVFALTTACAATLISTKAFWLGFLAGLMTHFLVTGAAIAIQDPGDSRRLL